MSAPPLAAMLCVALVAAALAAPDTTVPSDCTDEESGDADVGLSFVQVRARMHATEVAKALPAVAVDHDVPHVPLFCFCILRTHEEASLLEVSYQARQGIFGCDEFVVYSNISASEIFARVPTLAGVQVEVLPISLDVLENENGAALNTPIFWELWKRLYSQGAFRHHDWTVKVDPDTVFIPQRLRHLLEDQCGGSACPATFLQSVNAWDVNRTTPLYLHGAIEVLSRAAVETFGDALAHNACMPEEWPAQAEDHSLQDCLTKLGVHPAAYKDALMRNQSYPAYDQCGADQVAYHSLKSPGGFAECLLLALTRASGSKP